MLKSINRKHHCKNISMPVAKLSIMRHKIRWQKIDQTRFHNFSQFSVSRVRSRAEKNDIWSSQWNDRDWRSNCEVSFVFLLLHLIRLYLYFHLNRLYLYFYLIRFNPRRKIAFFGSAGPAIVKVSGAIVEMKIHQIVLGNLFEVPTASRIANWESLSGFLKKIVGIQCFAKGVGKAKGQKIPHSFTLIMLLINFVASKSLTRLFWPKILPGSAITLALTLQIYFYQINCPKICLKLGHKKLHNCVWCKLRQSWGAHFTLIACIPCRALLWIRNTIQWWWCKSSIEVMMKLIITMFDIFRCDDHNVHMTSFCTILSWKGNDIRKSYKRKDQVKFD